MPGPLLHQRDAAIRAEIAHRGGIVPTCRQMAAVLGVTHVTVSRDYQRLGLVPTATAKRTEPSVHLHLPPDVFDRYCRVARQRGVSVRAVIRAAVIGRMEQSA